jgi:acyl carrier protein phosphodiesterase
MTSDKEAIENKRFPIGRFQPLERYSQQQIEENISILSDLPQKLISAVEQLNDDQLDTAYREGGWTVRQVVHHMADSHVNSYVRFKLALTENSPVIKPYLEKRWAELEDARHAPVIISLSLISSLHKRWVLLLRNFKPDDWDRKFIHPDNKNNWTLVTYLHLYAWHCNHHLAHITRLKERKGWQ